MHSRMRHRVAEFLKILNRAKMENKEAERKTVTYVVCLFKRNLVTKLFLKGVGHSCNDRVSGIRIKLQYQYQYNDKTRSLEISRVVS